MLVKQLVGPLAGQNIHMIPGDGRLAVDAGTVRPLTQAEQEQHAIAMGYGRDEVVEQVEAARPVAAPIPEAPAKRRGGWPKGKPRGPRLKPDLLA